MSQLNRRLSLALKRFLVSALNVIFWGWVVSFLLGCIPPPGLDERVARAKRKEAVLREATLSLRLQSDTAVKRAHSLFQLAREIDPREPRAYDGLGCVATYRGRFIEAEKFFRTALRYDRRYARAYVNLAFLATRQGQNERAVELLEYAIRLDPLSHRARNNYAVVLIKGSSSKAEKRRALDELRKASSLAPPGDNKVQNNVFLIDGSGAKRANSDR
jgi:Tfp pilus assembly protein PilF